MRIFINTTLFLCFSLAVAGAQEPQQSESYIRLHYTKHEYMVPMRDGVKLMTSVFVPNDTTKTYPMLMKRTPYNVAPYGADKYPSKLGPSEHFVTAGYIFVNQDVRRRFASEGTFFRSHSIVSYASELSSTSVGFVLSGKCGVTCMNVPSDANRPRTS